MNITKLCKVIALSIALFSSAIYAKSSVWQVSHGEQQLFIGGTVHLLPASEFPLPAEFDKAYQQADQLVFEVDIGKINDPAVTNIMMQHAMYQDGRSLSSVLSAESYQRLQSSAAELGVDITTLEAFKPDFVLLIMMQTALAQAGMAGEGVDAYYFNKATKDGKALAFLETIDEQFAMLLNVSDGHEDDFLTQNLDQLEQMETFLQQTISAWREGDRAAMAELVKEMHDTEVGQRFYRILLTERNQRWVTDIKQMLATPEVELVLVGALHLAGRDNVLDLLKAEGYQVRQLNAE